MGKSKNHQTGQALLLVLLAMATLATMMLSVVSRSVNEVGVTTREEESLRAFSAAEAGVEDALISGTQQQIIDNPDPIQISNSLEVPAPGGGKSVVSTYNAEIARYPEKPREFPYPFELTAGQSGSVWFVTREGDSGILPCTAASCFGGNSVTLCWGDNSGETAAALVSLIYEDSSGNFPMAQVGYDSSSARRLTGVGGAPPNNYNDTAGDCNGVYQIDGQSYSHRANIDFPTLGLAAGDRPILMRVTMLYNPNTPQTFGVSAGSDLPIQGRKVSAEGESGDTTRRINAYLLNPEMPFIYDAALYSQADITK